MNEAPAAAPRADLANWMTAPHSRWAFHNVDAVLETTPVRRGDGPAWTLPQAPRGFDPAAFRIPRVPDLGWDGFLAATATDAIVIVHEGRVVLERYGHGNDARTPHILMSASKAVTGLLAGLARADGRLDVAAAVTDYVPEVAGGPYAGSTVRQLLDMRTGVRLAAADERAYAAAGGWSPRPGGAPADLHAFLSGLRGPPAQPHGGPFAYISPNTDLLAWVLERATGERLADYASRRLWAPLGAERDAYVTTDDRGAPRATGGFCVTARDFARLGQLVLDGGVREGARVLPADWLADLEMGGDPQAWADGEWGALFRFAGERMRYRAGWYGIDAPAPRLLFAMGVHGQNLFVDRANRLVVAKLSSQAERSDARAIGLTHWALPGIRRAVGIGG